MRCTADFETTTDLNDCRVWAWAICDIDNTDDIRIGTTINHFMDTISHYSMQLYFHNLKFDGEFILIWLLSNGFQWVKKFPKRNEFSALIDNAGKWYSIQINFGPNTVMIYDSLKIIPFGIEALPKMFGLKESKLKINYRSKRAWDHNLTQQEKEYIKHDVVIAAKSLKTLFDEGLTKMTQGANALSDFKNIMGKKEFKMFFPQTKFDTDIRQSYKGGFTYLNPKFKGKIRGKGIVLDVNSLYPYVMYDKLLPYGEPIYFEGKYKPDKHYPLYVQMLRCQFELKPEHLPTIQIKNTLSFMPTQYLESSMNEDGIDEEVTLCLTSVDLNLFIEHYEIYNEEWLSGYKFMGYKGFFKQYIDKWMSVKIQAQKDGNEGMRTLAKLMLNALYGKFGTNPNIQGKIPRLVEGRLVMELGEKETRPGVYIPMATFITAYAREKTIRSAQTVYNRFMYADTDSLHLLGTDIPAGLEVDPFKLGAWKHEATFRKCKYIRQKSYIEEIWNDKSQSWEIKVTCAGLPHELHKQVTFDNFNPGKRFYGKLRPVHVQGGVVLIDTFFTIRG